MKHTANPSQPVLPSSVEPLWTARQVAQYLQASQSAVYKWAEQGSLPCRRIGALLRFIPAQVRAWAEGRTTMTTATVRRLPVRTGEPESR